MMEWSGEVKSRANAQAVFALGSTLGHAGPFAEIVKGATILESGLKLAQAADLMPADADIVMIGTLTEDQAVHVGIAARIGSPESQLGEWKIVGDIGLSRDKKISGQVAILGKF
jgi:hypothetical protein